MRPESLPKISSVAVTHIESGLKIYLLTTIKPTGARNKSGIIWECRCECGSLVNVATSHLKRGAVMSCGCVHLVRWKFIIGLIFGRLKVVGIKTSNTLRSCVLAECECSCGNRVDVKTARLVAKHNRLKVVSCGCWVNPVVSNFGYNHTLPYGRAAINRVIGVYKKAALDKGLPFELEFDHCLALFGGECYLCGCLRFSTVKTRSGQEFSYNGIDRVDPLKGYVVGNVESCCIRCNRAKSNMTMLEFRTWFKSVSDRIKS